MIRSTLLVLAVAALAGCAELGTVQDVYRQRYPDRTSSGRTDRDDYARTAEYRRITSDAADYARRVDDALRGGSGQERRIRDLLTDRTARLLQRTNARDHRAVYPFPRRFSGDSRAARTFWDQADRDIERLLGRQDADTYRRYVRAGGRYDDRYRDDRTNNGRYRDGTRDDRYRDDDRRDDDRRDEQGRDDGERGDDGDDDDDRDDDGRDDRTDQGRRTGETLQEWYRRQAQRPR